MRIILYVEGISVFNNAHGGEDMEWEVKAKITGNKLRGE